MADEAGGAPSQGLERKVATILSADVAGYSRLMAEDEEATLRTFRAHRELFEQLVALHRGRVFNTAGDAILAEFSSAVEAVRCATEIQAALRTRNDQLPAPRRVAFRIGVNLGDVMVHGTDLLGDGVNVAARLQTAAQPGGVCLSGSVYDQVRDKLSLGFKSLGEQSFKNIPHPIRTFAITEGEAGGALPSPPSATPVSLRRVMKPVAAVVLVSVLAGAAVWAYVERQRREADIRAETLAAEDAQRRAALDRRTAEIATREAEAAVERSRAEQAARAAEAEKKQSDEVARPRPKPATAAVGPSPTAGSGPSVAAAVARDGVYAGPICYGPAANDIPRCYRAQGVLAAGKVTGTWLGRDRRTTMILSGLVSDAGDASIEIRGERDDHALWWSPMTLAGSLREGKLDATGTFASNGRSVTLSWQRQ
jgi:adenylate cyclase